jgi:hypothetical protein
MLCYGFPLGTATYFAFPIEYGQWIQAAYFLSLILAWWVAICLMNYADYWHMKTKKDWLYMAFYGSVLALPADIIFLIVKGWEMFIVVLLGGAAALPIGYWLGWKTPTVNKQFLNQGTEWGEIYSGALLGLAISIFF